MADKVDRGPALLDRLQAETEITGDLAGWMPVLRALGDVRSLEVIGGATVGLVARVEDGRIEGGELQPDTRLRLQSQDLQVRRLNVMVSENAKIAVLRPYLDRRWMGC